MKRSALLLLLLIPAAVLAQARGPAPPPSVTPPRPAQLDPAQIIPDHPPLITPETVKAIDAGIKFLARSQARDGSFQDRNARMGATYPVAMSALAGMAFLAHGDTPTRGRYAQSVRRVVKFLTQRKAVRQTGLLAVDPRTTYPMYGHGFAMMFLGSVLGETGDPLLEKRIQRILKGAILLSQRCQSKDGGWYYMPNSQTDEGSVTITQVQGLRACQNAGVAVPFSVIKRAIDYINNCQNSDGGIAYGLSSRGSSNLAISAAAAAVLYNAGTYDSPQAGRLLSYCRRTVKVTAAGAFGHWFYTHYYMAQVWWQTGGPDWDRYFPQVRDALIKQQKNDGSWDGEVGPTYATALATTILSLPYERVPLYMR